MRLFLSSFAVSLSFVCAASAMGQSSGTASVVSPPVTFTPGQAPSCPRHVWPRLLPYPNEPAGEDLRLSGALNV